MLNYTLCRGKTETDLKGNPLSIPIVSEVTMRTISKGQQLPVPGISADTCRSGLETEPYGTVLLYHDHGTGGQFRSELKTGTDSERLPGGRFPTDSFILLPGMPGCDLLRLCGQESLREDNGNIGMMPGHRKKAHRRRIRTVMPDFIYMAGRIIRKSGQWFISFGKMNPFVPLWNSVCRQSAFASG